MMTVLRVCETEICGERQLPLDSPTLRAAEMTQQYPTSQSFQHENFGGRASDLARRADALPEHRFIQL
jgi:hypothetical protein